MTRQFVRNMIAMAMGIGILLAVAAPATATAVNAHTSSVANCRDYTLPVALTSGAPADQTLWGRLCVPTYNATPSAVQLLIHGGSYDHNYWDFPYESSIYSYVDHVVPTGYATFDIDRIGDGKSSHPASSALDLYVAGYVAHQVVQDLRNGTVGGHAFSKVIEVGHSLGSYTTWAEAGTYQDVDGVILTGVGHNILPGAAKVSAAFVPANTYPEFAGLDSGYLTTATGQRGVFYYLPGADPAVVNADEALRQTDTSGETASVGPLINSSITANITAPVLLVTGQYDVFFCDPTAGCTTGGLQASEAKYYGGSPSVTAYVLPQAGHDINLHRDAPAWYAIAIGWAESHVHA